MALVSIEFVGHHRIAGRLVNRWDASRSEGAAVRVTDRGVVVEEWDLVRTIPWTGVLALVETRRDREKGEKR